MKEKVRVPQFRTEAEEAKWWADHREETAEWMKQAARTGRTTDLATIRRKRESSGSTPTISIRIDPVDLSRARVLAERRGLKYQTYLKMLLHEAIEKEGQLKMPE